MLVKATGAAVEVVLSVVGRQGVLRPVQGEGGPADAVAVPADEGADILVLLPVVLQGVKPQHHVHRISVPVGDDQGLDRPAVGEDAAGELPFLQGDGLHRRPVRHGPEGDPFLLFHVLRAPSNQPWP